MTFKREYSVPKDTAVMISIDAYGVDGKPSVYFGEHERHRAIIKKGVGVKIVDEDRNPDYTFFMVSGNNKRHMNNSCNKLEKLAKVGVEIKQVAIMTVGGQK